ncbi:MAG TPA: GlsB/YeaQ/YmgE family stress response membrane protein [Actinomycetota bacterium]|nr:GlsB/YeaQ/YmgE family stress response membrane protein [Actinomycetota bacterium]
MAVGWVAQLILGRETNWAEAFIAGIVGSFVGGLIASLIAGDGLKFRPSGIIGSIIGAIVVLAIWGAVRGRPRQQPAKKKSKTR